MLYMHSADSAVDTQAKARIWVAGVDLVLHKSSCMCEALDNSYADSRNRISMACASPGPFITVPPPLYA